MNVSVKLSTIVTSAVFYGVIESYRAWNGSKYVSDFVTHSPAQSQPEFNLRIIATISTKYDIYILRRFAQKSPNVGDLIKYFIPLATFSIKSSPQVNEVSVFWIQQQTKKLSVHIWKYSMTMLDTMEWTENNVDIWSSDPGLAKIKKPKWIPDRCQAPILWKYGNVWGDDNHILLRTVLRYLHSFHEPGDTNGELRVVTAAPQCEYQLSCSF